MRHVVKVRKLLTSACQNCDGESPSKKIKLASDHIILLMVRIQYQQCRGSSSDVVGNEQHNLD